MAHKFSEMLKKNGFIVINEVNINSVMFMYKLKGWEDINKINEFNKNLYNFIKEEGKYYVHQFSIYDSLGRISKKKELVFPLRYMSGNPNLRKEDLEEFISYLKEVCIKISKNELIKNIKKVFPNRGLSIVEYGSFNYKTKTDYDVAIFVDNFSENEKNKIIDLIENFHNENDLKIDKEIPYFNKLLYTYDEIEILLKKSKLLKLKEQLLVPILKTEEYLKSNLMKERLLVNILTSKTKVVLGKKILKYQNYTLLILSNFLLEVLNKKEAKKSEMNELLLRYNGEKIYYKDYLGYKSEKHISDKISGNSEEVKRQLALYKKEGNNL